MRRVCNARGTWGSEEGGLFHLFTRVTVGLDITVLRLYVLLTRGLRDRPASPTVGLWDLAYSITWFS